MSKVHCLFPGVAREGLELKKTDIIAGINKEKYRKGTQILYRPGSIF